MKLKKDKKKAIGSKFFNDLKTGLADIITYKKGNLALRSENIEIPAPPTKYKAKDIKRIRLNSKYSQGIFAKVLNVSIRTIQSWESGARMPSHSSLRLLEIVDRGIYRP